MIPVARPIIGEEEKEAVCRVIDSGMLAQGPEVAAFEEEFAHWVGGAKCIAVNSGTSALHLGLIAAGIGSGDEVIVPSFSFAATANAVVLAGATPVFADIEDETYCLNPASVEELISSKTRAILPVHLYGHPANMEELTKIATRHNINILEDAAQAHGARVGDQQVGSFGVTAAFSFYPTKNMTSGEGGMVTTQCPHIERKLRLLRNQGMEKRYENEVIGFNLRMTDIHAAIGRVQLQRLGEWTAARQANAAYLTKHIEGVITPKIANGCTHVFHQYTIQLLGDFRDEFANQLSSNGVGNGVYYPTPIHRLPSFEKRVDLPVTEKVAARVLSLPVHPSLTPENLEQIVSVVNDAAKYFS